MGINKQIKIGALISYFTVFLNIILGLIYTPWMIKTIGVSDYGIYVLVISFLTYFMIDFGLGDALARFISIYKQENNISKINQILGLSAKTYIVIDIFILFILFFVYFYLDKFYDNLSIEELEKFKICYIIASFFSVISFPFTSLNGIFIAYEKFIQLKLLDFINKIGIVILVIISLFMGYKLYSLIIINSIVSFIIIIVKIYILSRNRELKLDFKFRDFKLLKEIFSYSIWTSIITISQKFQITLAPSLIASYSGVRQVAIFSVGNVMLGYILTFSGALNNLFLPKVAALLKEVNNRELLLSLMIKVGRFQVFISLLLFNYIILLGKEFIYYWMGEGFEESYYISILLIFPNIIMLSQTIAINIMSIENKLKYCSMLMILSAIVSIILSIYLIPKFGSIGSAISLCISFVIFQNVLMNIIYYKIVKINIFKFFKDTFIRIFFTSILTLFIGYLLKANINSFRFDLFILESILIIVLYFFLSFVIFLNKNEKILIYNYTDKIIKYIKK